MGIESLQEEYAEQSEALRALRISRVTEWRLHQKGIGPPRTYVGRKILFKVADLRAWLERQGKSRERNIDRGQRKSVKPASTERPKAGPGRSRALQVETNDGNKRKR